MYAHFFWSSLVKKALKVCFCDFLVLARTAGVSERLFDWLWCCLVQGHRAFSLFLYLPSQECSLHASSVLCIIPKALTSRFWLWCFNLVFNFTLASFARKARTQEYGNFCYGFSLLQSTVFLPVLSKRWQPRATAFFFVHLLCANDLFASSAKDFLYYKRKLCLYCFCHLLMVYLQYLFSVYTILEWKSSMTTFSC